MPIVDTLKKLVKKTMEASKQDWGHVERVYKLSTVIAEKEDADVDLCQVGAILHDIGKVIGEPHNLTGSGRAKVLLRGMSYQSPRIERVLRIIQNHSYDCWEHLESLEEKIVGDADKLDTFGAIGLTRVSDIQGLNSLDIHDYRLYKEDIMLRYERLNTETAKAIGKKRLEFMK